MKDRWAGPFMMAYAMLSAVLCVLCLLSLSTAQASEAMAKRYGETVQARYALDAKGQQFLAGCTDMAAGDAVEESLFHDGYRLDIRAVKENEGFRIECWKIVKEWAPDDSFELWGGPDADR